MFFYISKIAGFFLQPTTILILMIAIGAILLTGRWRRVGHKLVCWGIILMGVCAYSPLGNILLLPLEDRFSRPEENRSQKSPDGIIILGGAADTIVSKARKVTALTEAAERMTAAVALARKFPLAKLVFSGGSGALIFTDSIEAENAAGFFADQQIAEKRIILESNSRNTYENAVYTKKLVSPEPGERWLLITSAFHMPRSIGCFRKAGFPVVPWPVDYRTRGPYDAWRFFDRPSEGLRRIDLVVREWIGLTAYWLSGKTDALLPGPE